jgi:hypothetical protein
MIFVVIPQEHYSEDTMLSHCSTDCGRSVPNNEAAFIESIVFNQLLGLFKHNTVRGTLLQEVIHIFSYPADAFIHPFPQSVVR